MAAKGKTFVRRRGTTAVPNATVHDARLSYNALGLLVVILGQPERAAGNGYRHYVRDRTGQAAVLSAFKELEKYGYRYQFKRKGKGGKFVTDTIVSETPMTLEDAEKWHASKVSLASDPTHGKPRTAARENPRTENHAWKPAASSVPEDQGSLSSYVTKEPVNPKSDDETDICKGCDRAVNRQRLTTSGYCPDCLAQQPEAPHPEPGAGRAQVLKLLAERRAKHGHQSPTKESMEVNP